MWYIVLSTVPDKVFCTNVIILVDKKNSDCFELTSRNAVRLRHQHETYHQKEK